MSPYLSQKKRAAQKSFKGCIQQGWNKILNIKLCIDKISGNRSSLCKNMEE
jgi:hypothetical protein